MRNYITRKVRNVSKLDDAKEFKNQSTLLGYTLMKNEDIQSFKWLFKCCLRCMGGKAPKAFSPTNSHRGKGPSRCACQK
ncbi:hypothetical protein Ahy_B04g072978 [Arachis hypogaea]|uniref:Protein FAR1-RELATED SEQUENCE n=1 Tax=Arachis hypogaea TaxID=3818 RepID=A0A444ZP89_ARAHY|nr:hypothetical protein Ahy_B04g072978 [Arachis hypogaea]